MVAPDRPAHRPSRRADLLEAGLSEFLARGIADTTIGAIAARAAMTPAAVYYHFPSKDDLSSDLVRRIGEEVVPLLSPPDDEVDMPSLVAGLLGWAVRRPRHAELYFLTSVGASPTVEAQRRDHQRQLCDRWRGPLQRLRPGRTALESDVCALALWSLFAELVLGHLSSGDEAVAPGRSWYAAGVEVARRVIGE